MMNKWLKSIMCIGFALMFCFLSIGYASLNDNLHVTGSVSFDYVETEPEETEPKPGDKMGTLYLNANDKVFEGNSKEGQSTIILTETTNAAYVCKVMFTLANEADKVDIDTYIHFELGGVTYSLQLNDDYQVEMDDIGSDSYKKFISDWNASAGTYEITITINKSQLTSAKSGDVVGTWTEPTSSVASIASYSLDTANVQNLSIESTEASTFDLESNPNLLLTFIPDEGYLLPESLTVTIGETVYTINTNGENELETMIFDTESSTLYISGDILPTDGSAVVITAYAVPEAPPYTVDTAGVEHMQVNWYTADSGLYVTMTPEEGYQIPESFTVAIGETVYIIYTTPEGAAAEGQPSVKNNPAGMGFDTVENKLFISEALLPLDGSTIVITATAVLPEEEPEETEPTEESTEPTEETTEPTAAPTDPTEVPTDPTEAPTDPTDEATAPTGVPTDPTEVSIDPTEVPIDPTDAPADPTETPTEPEQTLE